MIASKIGRQHGGGARAEKINLTGDSTDNSVSGVEPDPVRQTRGHAAAAKVNAHNVHDIYTSLDYENRWQWPVSYRSIEAIAIFVDILISSRAGYSPTRSIDRRPNSRAELRPTRAPPQWWPRFSRP